MIKQVSGLQQKIIDMRIKLEAQERRVSISICNYTPRSLLTNNLMNVMQTRCLNGLSLKNLQGPLVPCWSLVICILFLILISLQ